MLVYKSGSTGEEINLSDNRIKTQIKKAGLYDYEWELDESELKIGSKINGFGKKAKRYEMILDFRGNKEERAESAERLHRITERDLQAKSPGKLYFKGGYIECYIVGTKYEECNLARTVRKKMNVYAPYPFWITENPYTFHSYGVSSTDNKRYPGRYPCRYANGMNNTYIQNPHFTDANFTLVIYGPVANPQVIIGDKSYLVNIVLEQGERLEIDSRTRIITKVSKNGEQVNAFHNREKGKTFFKKIPPGRQKVVWSGKFDWDLVIYEERSEPRWSGWKQH